MQLIAAEEEMLAATPSPGKVVPRPGIHNGLYREHAERRVSAGVVVEREPDAGAAARRAARLLADAVREALSQRGAAHVALSGGNTPRVTYVALGPLVPDWRGVHLWFADERCVGPDDPESNARLVRETLVAEAR